jgi:drug/metabolite transporter (DMT)-like permease
LHSIVADLLLLLVALIWGLTFPAIKDALDAITPFAFLTIRFSIACLFLLVLYPKNMVKISRTTLIAGLIIGTALFLGYGLQTVGIQYTTASNAAFITGLAVVLVPIINIPFSKKLPTKFALLGAISAAFGLSLLSLGSGFNMNYGDFLMFLCAIAFATHIVLVSKYAPKIDTTLLTIIQISAVALFSGITTAAFETFVIRFTREVWIGLAICAIPATALAYWIQNKVQQYTSPARTAIIFSMEPVFGAIFSYFWLGELLTTKGFIGCGFVLLGMLLAELKG